MRMSDSQINFTAGLREQLNDQMSLSEAAETLVIENGEIESRVVVKGVAWKT
jgi:hypothetical protein